MFTKLLIKGKGKIKCRIHLAQVCIRLADACSWTKHQYGDSYGATLKAGTVERRNGGMAEWRKMTPNPKTRNGGK